MDRRGIESLSINFILLNYPNVKIFNRSFFSFLFREKLFLILFISHFHRRFSSNRTRFLRLLFRTPLKTDSRDRHGFIKNFFIPIPYETF